MKYRHLFNSFLLLALFLALAPAALASNTWYVDGVNGNDNNNCKSPQTACKTIGHAISLASSGDSIKVAAATYTENLTISISLNILGANASTTIVDGGGNGSVVTIPSSTATVTLSELTIQNGQAEYGGGVANNGTLTVNNSTISGNSASYRGGSDGNGGGIWNDGTLTLNNTTFSGNRASYHGGGIFGTATIQNSIVANSSLGGNCWGTMTSEGYNLSDDNTCNFNGPGDLNDTKAKLGKLGNHGGPTQTIPEALDSPTVDAGNPSGCTDSQGHLLTTDQRGYPRPGAHKHDKRCDMGAYERQTD